MELDFSKIVKCFDKVFENDDLSLEFQKKIESCNAYPNPNGAQGLKYLTKVTWYS